MRTLLIHGAAELPEPLRDIVERGSTGVVHRHARDADLATMLDTPADRIVFWDGGGDAEIRTLGEAYAARDPAGAQEGLFYVTSDAAAPSPGLSATQLFLWPRDEDRLRMAFMTGA